MLGKELGTARRWVPGGGRSQELGTHRSCARPRAGHTGRSWVRPRAGRGEVRLDATRWARPGGAPGSGRGEVRGEERLDVAIAWISKLKRCDRLEEDGG